MDDHQMVLHDLTAASLSTSITHHSPLPTLFAPATPTFFPPNTLYSFYHRAFAPAIPFAWNSHLLIWRVTGFFSSSWSYSNAFSWWHHLKVHASPLDVTPLPINLFLSPFPAHITLWNYLVFSCVYFGSYNLAARSQHWPINVLWRTVHKDFSGQIFKGWVNFHKNHHH